MIFGGNPLSRHFVASNGELQLREIFLADIPSMVPPAGKNLPLSGGAVGAEESGAEEDEDMVVSEEYNSKEEEEEEEEEGGGIGRNGAAALSSSSSSSSSAEEDSDEEEEDDEAMSNETSWVTHTYTIYILHIQSMSPYTVYIHAV